MQHVLLGNEGVPMHRLFLQQYSLGLSKSHRVLPGAARIAGLWYILVGMTRYLVPTDLRVHLKLAYDQDRS
jgi:hypothetical protein